MSKGIVRKVVKTMRKVNSEIATHENNHIAGGLASEGYAGGYRDALSDVLLILDGNKPDRRTWWEE